MTSATELIYDRAPAYGRNPAKATTPTRGLAFEVP